MACASAVVFPPCCTSAQNTVLYRLLMCAGRVDLSPSKVIAYGSFVWIQNDATVKRRRVSHRCVRKVFRPVEYIARSKIGRESRQYFGLPPVIQVRGSSEQKAEFIRFTKSKDDIFVFGHDVHSSTIHEFKSALVVGFCEPVLLRKSVPKRCERRPIDRDSLLVKRMPI